MAWGLKAVARRRNDALSRVGWEQLEVMLAAYYRGEGYVVQHVGTGGSKRRFDGGIDLKLRKDDAYVLVQCKHWNAYQVTHNAVHELLGLMINECATGAVLVTSGEFTPAAIEAATRHGHVRLIDGEALRELLGPLPDDAVNDASDELPRAAPMPATVQTDAAKDQERWLEEASRAMRGPVRAPFVREPERESGWPFWLRCVVAGMVLWFGWHMLHAPRHRTDGTRRALPVAQTQPPMQTSAAQAAVARVAEREPPAVPSMPPIAPVVQIHRSTAAEIREDQRKADAAIKVIEATTPEMRH